MILVDPKRHPHVRAAAGQRFIDWLISPAGQMAIAGFRIGGEQAFFPVAPGARGPTIGSSQAGQVPRRD